MRYTLPCAFLFGLAACHPGWGPMEKTPVTSTLYQKLVDYAGYAGVTLPSCSKASTGAIQLQYFNIASTDTQAAIWKLPSRKEIIVSFPGVNSTTDTLTSINFYPTDYKSPGVHCKGGCRVHRGFLRAWNSLAPEVMPALKHALSENPDYNTVLAGNSLGGALATLAFASLVNGDYRVTTAYTYGQPRVGNPAFANYIDSLAHASNSETGNFFRATHYNDGVPLLPPQEWGFRHSRTEFWQSNVTSSQSTTYRCVGQEPRGCVNGAGGFGVNEAHGGYAGLQITCT